MSEFFLQNMDIIYFFYGLSFLLMGIAILIQLPFQENKSIYFPEVGVVWMLGVFGVLHGLHEYFEILIILKEEHEFLKNIDWILVFASFFFLFIFSLELYRIILNIKNPKTILNNNNFFYGIIGIYSLLVLGIPYHFSNNFNQTINIFSRYFFCLPSSLLISKDALQYFKYDKEKLKKFKIDKYIHVIGISFLFYGITSGIFVEKAEFFPANIINKEIFFQIFGFPVITLRMISAFFIAWAIFNFLRILNQEYALEIKSLLIEANLNREELKIKTKQLEEANKVKNDFIASVTHELKTPLNSILGFSEILLDKSAGPLNEKQIEYLKNIEISGKRLLKMILSIINISKIGAHHIDFIMSNFSIKEVINQAVNGMLPLISKKKIKFSEKIEILNEIIIGDVQKVRQIIDNLLSNAVKFTSENGRIELRIKVQDKFFKNNIYIKYILIEVEDTGIGISPENITKIFEKFVQIDHNISGSGLGLAICKKFVGFHGGEIGVKSVPGAGSTFYFTLPIINEVYANIYFPILQSVISYERENIPLVFCKIKNLDNIGDEKKQTNYLNLVEEQINSLFRMDEDKKIFHRKHGIFLILLNIDFDKCDLIIKRINENIKKSFSINDYDNKLELEIKVLYFKGKNPEDILAECMEILT